MWLHSSFLMIVVGVKGAMQIAQSVLLSSFSLLKARWPSSWEGMEAMMASEAGRR